MGRVLRHRCSIDGRFLVPSGPARRHRLRRLESEAAELMRELYEKVDLPGVELLGPRLQAHVDGLQLYRETHPPPLALEVRQSLARAWDHAFDQSEYTAQP